jgi:hypothetical protein
MALSPSELDFIKRNYQSYTLKQLVESINKIRQKKKEPLLNLNTARWIINEIAGISKKVSKETSQPVKHATKKAGRTKLRREIESLKQMQWEEADELSPKIDEIFPEREKSSE